MLNHTETFLTENDERKPAVPRIYSVNVAVKVIIIIL